MFYCVPGRKELLMTLEEGAWARMGLTVETAGLGTELLPLKDRTNCGGAELGTELLPLAEF